MNSQSDYHQEYYEELKDKEFRDIFVREFIQGGLPFQIRILREDRGLTQRELGEKVGMRQSAISRVEDPDYGALSLKTLLRLASAFDVGLLVRFAAYGKIIETMEDLSPEALAVPSFEDDPVIHGVAKATTHNTPEEVPTATAPESPFEGEGDTGNGSCEVIPMSSLRQASPETTASCPELSYSRAATQ